LEASHLLVVSQENNNSRNDKGDSKIPRTMGNDKGDSKIPRTMERKTVKKCQKQHKLQG
jgi:hypothetical protein